MISSFLGPRALSLVLRRLLAATPGPVGVFAAPVRRAVTWATGLCLGFAATSAVQAQSPQPGAAGLDPQAVVVTATRTPTRVDAALAEVTVIERSQIAAHTGRNLASLLAEQPGLQFWSNGGLGAFSSVSIRGLEARHTLLLIDGVRYGSATVGTPVFENIPLQAIERIEIVRGPLSALYGSDAVGGVIQVFTKSGAPGLQPSASLGVGSEGHRQLSAGLRFGAGAVDGALTLQALRDKGFSATNPRVPFGSHNPDRDGFDQDSAALQLGLALPAAWRLQARALHSAGTSWYDDGPGADSRAGLLTQVMSLQAAGPVLGPWRSSLLVARSTDEYDTQVSASRFATLGVIGSVNKQLSWENTVETAAGTLLVLAERLEQVVSRPGAAFAVSQRSIDGLGVGLNGQAGVHHWQAALRNDSNSQFGRIGTGSVGYGVAVSPQLRLGLSAGTSFNAPSFNQLYFPNFGNPALLPEEGRHRELSLRWAAGPHELRAALFDSDIRGYITPGRDPTNVDASIEGLSLSASTRWAGWALSLSGDFLDPRNSNPLNSNFGKLLPRRAQHLLRLDAERTVGAWTVGAKLNKVGARFDNAANTDRLRGYSTLDLRADWALASDWRLGLKLNNAADARYESTLGYNQPGREWMMTLRYGAR